MTRAFAYLRVSGKGQLDGDGFTRQRAAIEKYAAANNIEIEEWFEEKGVSGTTDAMDRPAMFEALQAVQKNGTKILIVERLDRLSRDLMIQESAIAEFTRKGLTLISATEPDMMSNDPTRILMRQMLGAFAQFEKTMLVAKMRVARERIRGTTGRCEGAKPYGETEHERAVIGYMRQRRLLGWSFDKIAEQLNFSGFQTRHGKRWYGTTVKNILNREVASV